jgi:murein DD-endopeptidase MepM/ murein hydrolase activator NlpD
MPRLRHAAPCWSFVFLSVLLNVLFAVPAHAEAPAADPARTRTQLSLPTPIGERWKIIQGYACGTHNSWDRYSLDLVAAEGRTAGASVRAAADGVVFAWVGKSGTLILSHGNGLYTMYTHMESAVTTQRGTFLARGAIVGAAGDRGSRGTPHVHFTAFTADGAWARNRQSIPLNFAEGYDLPESGGCSQHQGKVMVAADPSTIAGLTDHEAPTLAALPAPITLPANQPAVVSWPAAQDSGSGVIGYRIYIGPDPQGTSDWFIPDPEMEVPALASGHYLLRAQPLDAAGNAGTWITLTELVVE